MASHHKPNRLHRSARGALALWTVAVVGLSACGGGDDDAQPLLAEADPQPATLTPKMAAAVQANAAVPLEKKAADLARRMGKPPQFLVGLGGAQVEDVRAQGVQPDLYDRYLVGIGPGSWPSWNSPAGAYVGVVAQEAAAVGAVPMFTLYQMAAWGDGNLSGLRQRTYMRQYWNNVRILVKALGQWGRPALLNLEPDFWGYAQRLSADPNRLTVQVKSVNPDCANQPNTATGMAACLLQMVRQEAPQTLVGFVPSSWGDLAGTEVAYLRRLGAHQADYVAIQTLDRDAGCFEAGYTDHDALCNRPNPEPYLWDDTNQRSPNFTQHLQAVRAIHEGLGLPVVWWQTPMGVPSDAPGGSPGAFRDNRSRYFLTRTQELVNAGGAAAVFSPGHHTQTDLRTDGGQHQRLSAAYRAAPVPLP